MHKTLTLSEPKQFSTSYGVRTVIWDLLDDDGKGYRISWVESASDTNKPKCRAFPCKHKKRGARCISWSEKAVSYNHDAALALRDVMAQLRKKYGYEYDTTVEIQLLPGEVVADGNR